jgi:dienelactone hydrolase
VNVLLFHHAMGLTEGVRAFAGELREAGHQVSLPDLYGGRTFPTVDEGVTHAEEVGFEAILAAGAAAADDLPAGIVCAGFSLGALPAQQLAQRRPGVLGALLYHSAVPPSEFGGGWPSGLPLQMHIMADDPWDDLPVMRELERLAAGELFVYEGDAHLFTDRSVADHDPQAARLVMERTLAFLDRLG